MRATLPTMILSLAATLPCFAWSAIPAEAGSPGVSQATDSPVLPDHSEYVEQGEYAASAEACNCCDCGPRWIFAAEAIALQRSTTRSQVLFEPLGQSTVDPLNAKYLDFPVAYGPRISAIRQGPCGWGVEVAYFQVDGFTAQGEIPDPSATVQMVADVNGTGYAVTGGAARYTSALYNGELNVRRQHSDRLTLLAGFRMVELNEHCRSTGTDYWTSLSDSIVANTFNHLYGFQIGADGEVFNRGGPLRINAVCKAGILGNAAFQNYHRISGETDSAMSSRSFSQTSFLGEVGLKLTYAITKRLAFRGSYEAMWLNGVALAPEQIRGVNLQYGTDLINTSGGVFYHGGGFGFEYRF